MRSPDTGSTLLEVLLAMAVASVALAAAAGLLGISARAVAESELETTAVWLAQRTVEEWRTSAAPGDDGLRRFDRGGHPVASHGVYEVRWSARPVTGAGTLWRLSVSTSSARLPSAVAVEVLIERAQP